MSHGVCPWWIGYLLASPLRRWMQNPGEILRPHVREGMTVLDAGCAMGFFTLPLARLVGPAGTVIAVDLQERMIRSLKRRADRDGLGGRIETRVCPSDRLEIEDLAGRVDFALAFAVMHEVPEPAKFLAEIRESLAPGGRLLMAEPAGHVTPDEFEETVKLAVEAGFSVSERPCIRRSRAVLLAVG
jgi:2-polyprenyl-3-methyl-5-hydroxy-6-metoxy-1,4-benzoquinol methylase